MSIVNDFEITVHAKSVAQKNVFSPCQVNVNSIFLTTDIREENHTEDKAATRIDLMHLFNTNGVIVTSAAETGGCETFRGRAQSALFILETVDELERLKTEGRQAHVKMLRELRVNII